MRLYNQCILKTAIGKTALTYDSIGTLTLTNKSNYIVGFYALIVNTKPTADEASCPQIRINSSDLGVSDLDLHGSLIGAEGMAAHQAGLVRKAWYSWSPPTTGKNLHFAEIKFSVTGIVACTEGFDCGIQLVTSDQAPTRALIENLKNFTVEAWSGGNVAVEAAGAGNSASLAAWGTDDPSMIVVDAKAKSMVGINYTIGHNAEVEVPLCNYVELVCSDINDFTPQQHLVQFGASASLGTAICSIKEQTSTYIPFVFDGLPNNKVKITVADINSLAGFTAGDGLLGMVWK